MKFPWTIFTIIFGFCPFYDKIATWKKFFQNKKVNTSLQCRKLMHSNLRTTNGWKCLHAVSRLLSNLSIQESQTQTLPLFLSLSLSIYLLHSLFLSLLHSHTCTHTLKKTHTHALKRTHTISISLLSLSLLLMHKHLSFFLSPSFLLRFYFSISPLPTSQRLPCISKNLAI
jgi:hypothetical protein